MNPKSLIGRRIMVFDGSKDPAYLGSWAIDMDKLIGNEYVVRDIFYIDGKFGYNIVDEFDYWWVIDPSYCTVVDDDAKINNTEFASIAELI